MSGRLILLLLVAGAAVAAAAAFGGFDPEVSNGLLFGAWLAALVLLFGLGLRLPVQARLSMWPALARSSAIVLAAIAVAVVANVGVYLHDVHFDLTAERRYTPPPQAQAVVAGLTQPMTVTYFYNPADGDALQAKRLLEILAHGAPLLRVDAVELDRQPALARRYEVQSYNTAVVETEGREVKVERTTDLAQIALGALRALRQQTPVVCFVTGHGEFTGGPGPTPPHFTHQETLDAHQGYGTEDRLMAAPAGLDRLYLALEAQGYEVRELALATLEAVPDDCGALADLGPRRPYAANEADLLHRYLGRGGGLLLGYDPEFLPGPGATALLEGLGVDTAAARVIDPLDHYGTDPEFVAVPSYTPHPITEGIALTFFPGARPLYIGLPPASITLFPLFGSSKDSTAQPLNRSSRDAPRPPPPWPPQSAGADPGAPDQGPGPQILALALDRPMARGGRRRDAVPGGRGRRQRLRHQRLFRPGRQRRARRRHDPLAGARRRPAERAAGALDAADGDHDRRADALDLHRARAPVAAERGADRIGGMVAAPLTARGTQAAALVGAVLAAAFLIALAFTGSAPKLASFEPFVPAGVMARLPAEITRIELQSGGQTLVFARAGADRWRAGDATLSDSAAEHLARALRFLHVSKPIATFEGGAFDAAALAEMGFGPPRSEVTVFAGDEPALAIRFGGLNPSRTGQYARLEGQRGLLLMPLHVGREWQLLTRAIPDHLASARPAADPGRSP